MSPLRYYTQNQTSKLREKISTKNIIVDFAMRYGNPSIKSVMAKMQKDGCENLIVLPFTHNMLQQLQLQFVMKFIEL